MNKLDLNYQALLQDIMQNGVVKQDRTGTGTISKFGVSIRHKMSDGFPLLTSKKMSFKNITTELLWFLQGRTDLRYLLENGCHIWDGDAYKRYKSSFENQHTAEQYSFDSGPDTLEMFLEKIKHNDEFAEKWGELGPIYGKQWREWSHYREIDPESGQMSEYRCQDPIDQIENLINDLKTNPDSRRLIVSAWNVAELDEMVLPPCHYAFQVYTRELSHKERFRIHSNNLIAIQAALNNKPLTMEETNTPTRAISLLWNQRSCDTPLGVPYNIASYGLLLEILAKLTNMVPDELIGFFGDTHIYLNQIDGVKEQLNRDSYELPKLNIKVDLSNGEFKPEDWKTSQFELIGYNSQDKIYFPLSN